MIGNDGHEPGIDHGVRVAQYDRFGGPEVLRIVQAPAPTARREEVLVEVHAASVNRIDLLSRAGKSRMRSGRRLPQRVGLDFAGSVRALGPGAGGFEPGQRVWGFVGTQRLGRLGTASDAIAVPAEALGPAPAGVDWTQAGAIPLVGLTAWQALARLRVERGDRVMVVGGAGGVGSVAVQIAHALGAKVDTIAAVRHAEFVEELGIDRRYDPDPVGWTGLTGRYGSVLDTVGVNLKRLRRLLAPGGRIATIAPQGLGAVALSRAQPGPSIAFVSVRPDRADLASLAALVERGQVRPLVQAVYPLAAIGQAHRDAESGHAEGKRVIDLSAS
jgi:NADPH:quinone reductase-like Zn-dependent oxidoreductase